MSPAFAAVREIAAGRAPADNALLQNCRLEGFGTRAFGREPILEIFRRSPIDLPETFDAPESPRALLAVHEDKAVFADLHDARVARLWVFGDDISGSPEPAVSVPRDLDLSQFEADAVLDPADHPDLRSSDAPRLADMARSLARPDRGQGYGLPEFSRRAFVIRAFSAGGRMAALIVCAGALDGIERKPFSVNVALLAGAPNPDGQAPRLVVDRAGLSRCRERLWTPRL